MRDRRRPAHRHDQARRSRRGADPGPPAAEPDAVAETLDRDALWSAQTPQAFRLAALDGPSAAPPTPVSSTRPPTRPG